MARVGDLHRAVAAVGSPSYGGRSAPLRRLRLAVRRDCRPVWRHAPLHMLFGPVSFLEQVDRFAAAVDEDRADAGARGLDVARGPLPPRAAVGGRASPAGGRLTARPAAGAAAAPRRRARERRRADVRWHGDLLRRSRHEPGRWAAPGSFRSHRGHGRPRSPLPSIGPMRRLQARRRPTRPPPTSRKAIAVARRGHRGRRALRRRCSARPAPARR